MRIKEITNQHRRDFSAILECEQCGNEDKLRTGYDDSNYHNNVIPKIRCTSCGLTAKEYVPRSPKYNDGVTI